MKLTTKSGSVYVLDNGYISGPHGIDHYKIVLSSKISLGHALVLACTDSKGAKISISTSDIVAIEN